MKFTINKAEFLKAIQEVQRVTYGRVGITTLHGILIKSTNDNLVLTGGDIIRKLPDDRIEISTIDDNRIKIVCEKNIITLNYQSEDTFPSLPTIKEDIKMSIPQKIMKKMIRGTTFATEQNGIRPVYSGVLFDLKDGKLSMVALDNNRAAIYHYYDDENSTISAVIPGVTLNEVAKINELEDKTVNISFTSNHILFTIGTTRIISILLDGDFGKYEAFIPNEYTLKISVNRQNLIDNLERASIISREVNICPVIINVKESSMSIASNSQLGEISGELDIVSDGDAPMLIKVNSKYLLDALNVLEDDEVIIRFTTNLSVLVITDSSNSNSMHIIAPMRIQ